MAAPRIRRVANQRELEAVRDDFITQGYEILNEGERTLLMRKATWGTVGMHVVIGLLTVWWTFGIANLVYALIAHSGADQVMLKLDEPEATHVAARPIVAAEATPTLA